jgi:hypothetical protein
MDSVSNTVEKYPYRFRPCWQAIVETIRYVGTQHNGVLDRRVPFGQWCLCFDENKKYHGLGQHDFQWHVTRFAQFRTRPKKFGHVNYRWNVRMGQSSNWPIVDLSYEHGAPFPGPCFSPIPAQHRASAASISLSSIHWLMVHVHVHMPAPACWYGICWCLVWHQVTPTRSCYST